MQYEFRRAGNSAKTGRRRLFLATLIALFVVLGNIASGGLFSAWARDLVTPLWSIGSRVGNDISHSGFLSSRQGLEAQISALQAELQQEQLQAAAFEAVQAQNESLSQLTHLAQTAPGLAAPVTSSLVSSPYGTFTVGAGSADGVASGALVLSQGGFVIGTLTQVQAHQSLVQELFAPGVQTAIIVDGAASQASGEGGQAQIKVPRGVSVSQGDPVVAPGYGGRPVGTVAHVDSNPADAQLTLYIALPVSLASLGYVYITP